MTTTATNREPSTRLPRGPETVIEVRLYVDDPEAFLDEVGRYLRVPPLRGKPEAAG